jgi:DinB superfamily
MDVSELLAELFSRVDEHVQEVLDGVGTEELLEAPAPGSNPIGWLLWHLTRVQDMHIAEILEEEQVWVQPGWSDRFGLTPDPGNVGYGHSPDQVLAVRPDGPAAVSARTRTLLSALTPDALDRIVDRRWDPPVTMGVRLVSIADDDIQHAGQAAYVKGLLQRR